MTVQAHAEFCLLGIDHWAICMSKAEWASWAQVAVGLVAIYAASKAVRAAHQLAMSAKADEQFKSELRLIEKELLYLEQVAQGFEQTASALASGQSLPEGSYDALSSMCVRLRNTDYTSFEVAPLSSSFTEARSITLGALDALWRIDEGRRRRAEHGFSSERELVIGAAQNLREQVDLIDRKRVIFIKSRYP